MIINKKFFIILGISGGIFFFSYCLFQNYFSRKAKIIKMLTTTGETMDLSPYTFFVERVDKGILYNVTIECRVEPRFITVAKRSEYRILPYKIEFVLYEGYHYNPYNKNSKKLSFERSELAIPMIHK